MTKTEFIEKIKNGYGLSEELQDNMSFEQLEKSKEEEINYGRSNV